MQRPWGGNWQDRTGSNPALAAGWETKAERERQGQTQGHAAGRDGAGDVWRRHTRAGPLQASCPRTPARTFQAARGAASLPKLSQLLRGPLLSWFPCLMTNSVFLPSLNYATDIRGSATIWSHFLAWDDGAQRLSLRAERGTSVVGRVPGLAGPHLATPPHPPPRGQGRAGVRVYETRAACAQHRVALFSQGGWDAVPRRQACHRLPQELSRQDANSPPSNLCGVLEIPHLADGDTEAARGAGTCPGPHGV